MSNLSDFIIENGVLKKYVGPGGDVTIPEGVTNIGDGAFWVCKSLASVTIPESVTSIGDSSFYGCSSLMSVEIPESVTSIGGWAFWACKSLASVTIPEGVTSIGDAAFRGCSSLLSVEIPDSVTSIGGEAFSYCSSLTSVTIPPSVTSIGSGAFCGCNSLTSVTIPEGVTSISDRAFSYCSGLADADGFVIVKGVLYDYKGPGGDVVIPEGVTSIGGGAFSYCRSLTSVTIPEGVTSIGDSAFYGCSSLTSVTLSAGVTSIGSGAFLGCDALPTDSNGFIIVGGLLVAFRGTETLVTIPEGVTSIGDRAFCGCSGLTSVTIPGSVTSIGSLAFWGCESLTSVEIPDSVTSIGNETFYECSGLTSVTIRSGVTSIGDRAFEGCRGLTSVTIPDSVKRIGNGAFEETGLQLVASSLLLTSNTAGKCSFGLLIPGEQTRYLAYCAKTDCDNLRDFAKAGSWNQYDLELINNGPKYKYKLPARLLGALGRLLDPEELTEENRALLAELLNKNAKKLVPLAESLRDAAMLRDLLSLNILDAKTLKAVRKLMAASAVPEIAALASEEPKAAPAAVKKKTPAPAASPLQAEFAEKLKAIKGDDVIKKMKLIGIAMPKVKLTDGTEAPEELFRFLLASYGARMGGKPRFIPEADEAAKLLSYDSLCEAMEAVSGNLDGPNYPAVLPLLCRYGNARQIRALTTAWKDWSDWACFGQKGRKAQETLADALVLSDTREAVVWLEKNRNLETYAKLRGITVNEVYEKYLFDFGFDGDGKRVFDLGTAQIQVTLTDSLQLALLNTATGKAVKSIPRKGVDPSVQKKAADELSDMRQNLKKACKIKNDQLFRDHLDANAVPAAEWKQRYLGNAFLRRVAEILVWEQGGKSFLLTGDSVIDSAGQPYTLTDEAIKLAHPMEMDAEEVTAWQKHFTRHGLKQPFQQIWEPVIDAASFRTDRYKDCRVNPLYLKNQSRRGIRAEWYESEYYSEKYVYIQGFDVEADDAPEREGDQREYIEITSLRPKTWNRRANSVIAYLDRITVWDRVWKDDVSVMDQIGRFTLAQVTEMIQAAQEANAVNVLALLLEYKNAHFADFDPMDEFTLEW